VESVILTKTEHKSSIKPKKSEKVTPKEWHLYIVQTRLGHWYTGITTDVKRRFDEHSNGIGAKNLRGKGPLELVFHRQVGDRSQASILECQVKKLSKPQKRIWVADQKSQLDIKL
jgi:putative endonuclease